jgi:hypothetical protein
VCTYYFASSPNCHPSAPCESNQLHALFGECGSLWQLSVASWTEDQCRLSSPWTKAGGGGRGRLVREKERIRNYYIRPSTHFSTHKCTRYQLLQKKQCTTKYNLKMHVYPVRGNFFGVVLLGCNHIDHRTAAHTVPNGATITCEKRRASIPGCNKGNLSISTTPTTFLALHNRFNNWPHRL